MPWTGTQDGLRTGPDGFYCVGALRYEGIVRTGLLRMKFQGGSAATEPLGRIIAHCVDERLSGPFHTVSWVPVSRRRLRERGYDQSELLARSACRVWGVRPRRLLVKIRDNPPQSTLPDVQARCANVLGAYAPARGAAIAGRRILLIDDICTTGQTLRACARVLADAGAAECVCAVAALTGKGAKKDEEHT